MITHVWVPSCGYLYMGMWVGVAQNAWVAELWPGFRNMVSCLLANHTQAFEWYQFQLP